MLDHVGVEHRVNVEIIQALRQPLDLAAAPAGKDQPDRLSAPWLVKVVALAGAGRPSSAKGRRARLYQHSPIH